MTVEGKSVYLLEQNTLVHVLWGKYVKENMADWKATIYEQIDLGVQILQDKFVTYANFWDSATL